MLVSYLRSRGVVAFLSALAVLGSGCGDDGGTMDDMDSGMMMPDGGPQEDTSVVQPDSSRRDTGQPDTGQPDTGQPDTGTGGDGNDSFAEAAAVTVNDTEGTMGVIDPPGDSDYFRFEATAGQWLRIATAANPDDDPALVDTVITLYDSTMTQVAENDDAQPRLNTDSEIVYLVPADGTFYLQVQEWSAWAGDPPEGQPDYAYTLTVVALDGAAPIVTVDGETGDDSASATTHTFSDANFGFTVGTFRDESDVDVFAITVGGTEPQLLQSTVMPAGSDGHGSTTPAGEIWVTDSDGTILARIDHSAEYTSIGPSLAPGDYHLWVAHPGGEAGTHDYYVLKTLVGMENPAETDDTANDDRAGAQALEQTSAGGITTAFLLSHLSTDTDVDFFSFDVAAGEAALLICGSASSGSGVQGLTATIVDESDTEVFSMTEPTPEPIYSENVGIAAAGTYYLSLSKSGQDDTVTGDWVRCAVRTYDPM